MSDKPTERERFSTEVLRAETSILNLIQDHPKVVADSPFLAVRTGLIAKLLCLNEIYIKIVDVPGSILELGSWFGQSSVIFENLRAIHEPFNRTRDILSVDTFDGYAEAGGLEISEDEIAKYNTGAAWLTALEEIQGAHHAINTKATGRSPFRNIVGNILDDDFWSSNDLTSPIALCYFDIATYDTTRAMLQAVLPMMSSGGIVLLDDFGSSYVGVLKALREENIFQRFEVKHCKYFPSKLYLRVE